MRIALLTPEYPTEAYFAGGLASYLRRVGMALTDAGYEVEVFTLSDRQETIPDRSIVVHRVPLQNSLQKRFGKIPFLGRNAEYADLIAPSWSLAAALYERHREAPFNVVQASNFQASGLVATLRRTIPVVTRVSSYEPLWRTMYRRPLTPRQRHLEKAEVTQLKWSAAVYAPSVLLAESLRAKEGLKVRVIEPPFHLDRPAPGLPALGAELTADGYGLFFGSIGYLKGCDRLVYVLPGLLERIPQLKFVFVGPIRWLENRRFFDDYIQEQLGAYIGKRVFILNEQRHPALLQLVQNARFVVLPSKIDNLPNACMEAMALERVVIGARGASFEQLIEGGVNGFLISQEDDFELASCMERVWRMDVPERNRIGARAAQSLQRMRPENAISPLMDLFNEVGQQARPPDSSGVFERLHALVRPVMR
jgi:glycosyltransferase involved in cell wall biosynthesis